MSRVKTIVFPVGGFGTRFLPATKATPKEMLPVAEKPLIQYAFEEAREAGIERFIFVTGRNKDSIENHFDSAFELEKVLSEKKKQELLEKTIGWLPDAGHIIFLRQQRPRGLGHAVLCAERFIGNEPFAVSLADEMVYGERENFLGKMIKLAETREANVLGVASVARENVSKYGIVDTGGADAPIMKIYDMVEKPNVDEAPSNFSNVGRYVLNPEIFSYLKKTQPRVNDELQLTDAMSMMLRDETAAKRQEFYGVRFDDARFDCGNVLGYLEANIHYALRNEKIRDDVVNIINNFHRKISNFDERNNKLG